jgi:hypothetical protein
MPFEQIAQELGYDDPEGSGKNAVWSIYRSGMYKLRRQRRAMARLKRMAVDLHAARTARERGSSSRPKEMHA